MKDLTVQVTRVEATVREDKEQYIIIGLPDASIKELKERILNCLHAQNVEEY